MLRNRNYFMVKIFKNLDSHLRLKHKNNCFEVAYGFLSKHNCFKTIKLYSSIKNVKLKRNFAYCEDIDNKISYFKPVFAKF